VRPSSAFTISRRRDTISSASGGNGSPDASDLATKSSSSRSCAASPSRPWDAALGISSPALIA
jgi:hypothetical protein